MKERPASLRLLSFLLVCGALSFYIQIMVLFELSFWDVGAIITKLTWLNLAVMALSGASAALIWNARAGTLFVAPVAIVTVIINNWLVGQSAVHFDEQATFIASLGFLSLHAILLDANARMAFSQPEMRWWLNPIRQKLKIPIGIGPQDDPLMVHTFDVSRTGLFLTSHDEAELLRLLKMGHSDKISITFSVGDEHSIACSAEVVRSNTQPLGTYPAGLGIRFQGLSWLQRWHLLKAF